MKEIVKLYKSEMVQPIIKKVMNRFIIGLILALLWTKFNNPQGHSIFEVPFFLLGVIFIGLAWLNYLHLDGLSFTQLHSHMKKKRKEMQQRKSKMKATKEMVDFVQEDPDEIDPFEDDELTAMSMLTNIIVAACFLVPSIIYMYL